MVDATWQPVSNEAGLVAASARISRPLARSYLAVSVQDLMAADIRAEVIRFRSGLDGTEQRAGLCGPSAAPSELLPLLVELKPASILDLEATLEDGRRYLNMLNQPAVWLRPGGRGPGTVFQSYGEVDVLDAIDAATRKYPVDPDRVSLFGFSMGGAGVWYLGSHLPDRFSAIAPLGGYNDFRLWRRPGDDLPVAGMGSAVMGVALGGFPLRQLAAGRSLDSPRGLGPGCLSSPRSRSARSSACTSTRRSTPRRTSPIRRRTSALGLAHNDAGPSYAGKKPSVERRFRFGSIPTTASNIVSVSFSRKFAPYPSFSLLPPSCCRTYARAVPHLRIIGQSGSGKTQRSKAVGLPPAVRPAGDHPRSERRLRIHKVTLRWREPRQSLWPQEIPLWCLLGLVAPYERGV